VDLNEISVFIKVVQAGSFSQAAKQLGLPNSTVSHKVSSLEKRLGTTLITRTTRRLNITPAGQAFFKKALQGLEVIKSGEDEIASLQEEPQGLLRITAPVELGRSVLPPLISNYIKKYPKVSVEVILTDRRVELLAESVDLALRAGELKDSTLIGKKLGTTFFAVFASPKYLKQNGTPKHPRELKDYQCMHFSPIGSESWKLVSNKGALNIPMPGRLIINDLDTLRTMTINGMGIALLPYYLCSADLGSGKLVQILDGWQTNQVPVSFVYPSQKYVSSKLSAFIQLSAESIRQTL
jgi:DNA-binding transcriptional LysR family regulator